MNASVLVSHPGRQHSHRLAHALYTRGMLAGYLTGVPARRLGAPVVWRGLWNRLVKYDELDLPANLVHHCLVAPLLRKTLGAALSLPHAVDLAHRADGLFDRWSAGFLSRRRDAARAVICYENAALHTFEVASRLGVLPILDAAAMHHQTRDRWSAHSESPRVHARINARKDREIEHAALILTTSDLARESYIDAGVAPNKVVSVPVGVDTKIFSEVHRHPLAGAPFRFVFAGYASEGKGFDALLAALRLVQRHAPDCILSVAGNVERGLERANNTNLDHRGRLDQRALARLFGIADCLVLPSRSESFGMVVVEAQATGLPVIISDRVGARQAIEGAGSGWVVPANDPQALAEQMLWCVAHREQLAGMSAAARRVAERYTWDVYERDVVGHIERAVS